MRIFRACKFSPLGNLARQKMMLTHKVRKICASTTHARPLIPYAAHMHFQPVLNGLDENHTSGFPSLSILRDPPQLRFSTQGPHAHGIENPGPPPPQPPPALPRLSSAPHF